MFVNLTKKEGIAGAEHAQMLQATKDAEKKKSECLGF
jgi:hypothetical protein